MKEKNALLGIIFILSLSIGANANPEMAGKYLMEVLVPFNDMELYFAAQLDLMEDGNASQLILMGNDWSGQEDIDGTWDYNTGVLAISFTRKDVLRGSFLVDIDSLQPNIPQAIELLHAEGKEDWRFFITRQTMSLERNFEKIKIHSKVSNFLQHSSSNKIMWFFSHDISFALKFNSSIANFEDLKEAIELNEGVREIDAIITFPKEMTNQKLVYFGKGYNPDNYTIHVENDNLILHIWGLLPNKHVVECDPVELYDCRRYQVPVNLPYDISFVLELPNHLKPPN